MIEIQAIFIRERLRFSNADGDTIIGDIRLAGQDEQLLLGDGNANEAAHANGNGFDLAGPLAVKGKAELDELMPQQTYRFYGHWTEYRNQRSGNTEKQFAFQTFIRAQPHGRAGVIAYLKQAGEGNGIGQARATQLWEKFGSDAVRVLRETPEIAVCALQGLTIEKAESAAKWLKTEQALEGCTIDLINLLSGKGFPKDTTRRAVREWGNRSAQQIQRDPYSLMAFRGCGFKRCDALWMELGLPPSKLRRQALCAWYSVASDTEGHTWYPVEFAVNGLKKSIGGTDLRPAAAIKMAKRIGRLSMDRNGALATLRSDSTSGAIIPSGGKLWLAEGRKAWSEDKLAEIIVDSRNEIIQWPDIESIQGISDHQREQLAAALTGSVGILGGSPGTGKTYTLAALAKFLVEHLGQNAIGIGAPTGKAAVRITEALQQYGLPLRARTWHSLLGVGQVDELTGLWGFTHNENNPFAYKVLIGDESSMLDTNLMASIFRARAAGTMFLLVGDVNQLPPVGHGAPLRDLIAAGLPYGELREIKRNSGGIVEACAAIRDGKRWTAGDNLVVDECHGEETQIKQMLAAIRKAGNEGLDVIWDCQVVVAVNAKSKLSRKAVNEVLQAELNPRGKIDGSPFKVNDKIVNTKNGFFPLADLADAIQAEKQGPRDRSDEELQTNDRGEVYVANGELAAVVDVAEKYVVAKLSNPSRVIRIPRGKAKADDDDSQDGEEKASTGCAWDLGFALSVHKSQGSEWPVVVVMVDEYPGARMVCDRSWIYTAISRAKQRCVVIGKKATADRFCRQQKMNYRKTFLREFIHLKAAERVLVEL